MRKRGNESPDAPDSDSEHERRERSLKIKAFFDSLPEYEESCRREEKAVRVNFDCWMDILNEMLHDPNSRFFTLHGAMVRALVGGYLKCDGCKRWTTAPGLVSYEHSHPRFISDLADRRTKYICHTCDEYVQRQWCIGCSSRPTENHSRIWSRYPPPICGWVCEGCALGFKEKPCCSVCHCYSYSYDPEESGESDDDEDAENDEDEDDSSSSSSDSYLHSENSDNNDGYNDIGYLPDGTAICQICARKRRLTMCPAVDGYCYNFIPRTDDYKDSDLCAACQLEWESSSK